MKESMSFAMGFMGPRRNDGVMHTYSPTKAKRIVKETVSREKDIKKVYVGLDGDWRCNNDLLWDGKFHTPEFYSESCWAKPSLLFIYKDGKEKDGGYCYVDKKIK